MYTEKLSDNMDDNERELILDDTIVEFRYEINNPDTGNPNTQHSLNPVPCIVVDNNRKWKIINNNGGLSNISPTVLKMMGVEKPKEMTSNSLIEEY